ncbi:MAG TPA: hypothetical protein VG297_17490, partial [Bryobacteraceae bacterium]|nr:hypothetical protein [Bryobacteraceae bacterium]
MRNLHILRIAGVTAVIFAGNFLQAADYAAPAGEHFPLIGAAGSILPGGRFIKPVGTQIETGPEPSALAVSPKGLVATADIGLEHHGITVIEPGIGRKPGTVSHLWARTGHGTVAERADPDWVGVAAGIAFDGEKAIWTSEGPSGRVRQIDAGNGDRRKLINLNAAGSHSSDAADLAYDTVHRLLYVADTANSRIAVIDTRKDRVVSSAALGPIVGKGTALSGLALSPDGSTLYAAMARGVAVIDVHDPLKPLIMETVPTGPPDFVLAGSDRVFVSVPADDTIRVISAADRKVLAQIPLAIPGLEKLRGIEPAGMAYDPLTKWLLVAETGINAVGVVDTETNRLIGHIPVGWMPNRLAIVADRVFVTDARGRGTGPYLRQPFLSLGEISGLHRGTVTTFIVPDANELARDTGVVMALNGFVPLPRAPAHPPSDIRHVVLIYRDTGSFDEVLGDVTKAGNGAVAASPPLARFGMSGVAIGARTQFSVKDAPITPNLHALARQWAFSDNFYVDDERGNDGAMRLADILDHFRKNGISVRNFEDGSGTAVPDQTRADRFIAALGKEYANGGALPQLLSIHLPNDRTGAPADHTPYPYAASFVEDNDLATGRIVEYLSHSPWWREMVVLIVQTDTEGSFD